jgi:hypothetical protein
MTLLPKRCGWRSVLLLILSWNKVSLSMKRAGSHFVLGVVQERCQPAQHLRAAFIKRCPMLITEEKSGGKPGTQTDLHLRALQY